MATRSRHFCDWRGGRAGPIFHGHQCFHAHPDQKLHLMAKLSGLPWYQHTPLGRLSEPSFSFRVQSFIMTGLHYMCGNCLSASKHLEQHAESRLCWKGCAIGHVMDLPTDLQQQLLTFLCRPRALRQGRRNKTEPSSCQQLRFGTVAAFAAISHPGSYARFARSVPGWTSPRKDTEKLHRLQDNQGQ